MEEKLPAFKFIKKDAIVKMDIGAGMIEKLLEVLTYFSKTVTVEQIQKYQNELPAFQEISKKEKEFSEDWMYPVTTMTFFLQEIERQADLQGQTFEGDIEEYIKTSISAASEGDNQSVDQSQLQPE